MSTLSDVFPHQKWEGWNTEVSDIGTFKGKVPLGATACVLCLLIYGSRA